MAEESTEVVTTETVTTNEPERDEDYAWLTERLDAALNETRETRQAMMTAIETIRDQSTNQSSELKEANRMLTELVTTMSTNLTAIAASVSLRSTPNESVNILVTEQPEEKIPELSPANVAEESPVPEQVVKRKRRFL